MGHGSPMIAVENNSLTEGLKETGKMILSEYGKPKAILAIKDLHAEVDNTWGIDHGTWTPLVHMFPEADIPIVQLSVSTTAGPQDAYELGKLLAPLREEGYVILGSGNTVHNLGQVNWRNPNGTKETVDFDNYILDCILRRNDASVIHYDTRPEADYAVPTPEHFLPLLYILGASEGEKPFVFNHECNLGAIAMTSYLFG